MTAKTVPLGKRLTIGDYIELATVVWGEDSRQVQFLKSKITKENGLDEPVFADESQMIYLLSNM
jgi:hypothetical protein